MVTGAPEAEQALVEPDVNQRLSETPAEDRISDQRNRYPDRRRLEPIRRRATAST